MLKILAKDQGRFKKGPLIGGPSLGTQLFLPSFYWESDWRKRLEHSEDTDRIGTGRERMKPEITTNKIFSVRAEEMVQHLRTLATLPETPGSVPNTISSSSSRSAALFRPFKGHKRVGKHGSSHCIQGEVHLLLPLSWLSSNLWIQMILLIPLSNHDPPSEARPFFLQATKLLMPLTESSLANHWLKSSPGPQPVQTLFK